MNKKGFTLTELVIGIFIGIVGPAIVLVLSIWTDKNLEFWLSYFKNEAVEVSMWISIIITIIFNGIIIGLNILSELIKLVL